MLVILPPGSGKSHYHALGRGIDVETVLSNALGTTVIGWVAFSAVLSDDWDPYNLLMKATVRALRARFPSAALLLNHFHVPEEIPRTQWNVLVLDDQDIAANLSGRRNVEGMIVETRSCVREIVALAGECARVRIGISRAEMELESEAWSSPRLAREDVAWVRDAVFRDRAVIELMGTQAIGHMKKVESSTFHVHPAEKEFGQD